MRFKKTFFPTNLWKGEKNDLDKFSPKTTPLKLRGNENEIMNFWGFPKSGDENSLQIIFSIFFFFFEKKYILEISSPDFGKPQKFHDFVFSSPEFGQKSFPAWKRFQNEPFSPGERSSEFRRIVLN